MWAAKDGRAARGYGAPQSRPSAFPAREVANVAPLSQLASPRTPRSRNTFGWPIEIATLCDPPGIAARRSNARARCALSERERYQGRFANARGYQQARVYTIRQIKCYEHNTNPLSSQIRCRSAIHLLSRRPLHTRQGLAHNARSACRHNNCKVSFRYRALRFHPKGDAR